MPESRGSTGAPIRVTPVVLHVLLSLADGEAHAYGIMKEVEARTGGRMKIGPGSLHFTLTKLEGAGWIEPSDARPDPSMDDARRKYFRITERGRQGLEGELQLWAAVVDQPEAARAAPRSAPGEAVDPALSGGVAVSA